MALLRCLGFGECLFLSSWVSERLSVTFRPLSLGVFFLSLFLYGRASFLVVASDSFGTPVSLRDVVALWDESGFAWAPVLFGSLGSLRVLVSSFFVSGFQLVLCLIRISGYLCDVVPLWGESGFRVVLYLVKF